MPPTPTELRQRPGSELPLADVDGIIQAPDEAIINGTKKKDRKLVGVDGNWYDVTNFIKHHPGGPVIEQYIGQDATEVFHAYGHANHGVLDRWKPVGTFTRTVRHPADKEFEELAVEMKAKGYYETDWVFYFKKSLVVLGLLLASIFCVVGFESWYMHYLGAVVLAFVWQQSGFIMHEFMHTQVFRKHSQDRYGGVFFGTVLFGISAHWWRDEHIYHHAMTNTVDVSSRFVDPQMWESVFAQNEKMFPLFQQKIVKYAQWVMIKIQHITFVPIVVFIGRLEIVFDSFSKEHRPVEWIGWVIHWIWLTYFLSFLPTWREIFIFYAIAASVEGIFHFQLILSHYCKAFANVDDFHRNSWYEYQVLSNMNLIAPTWLDWYYGGLNYHIEHHLYPTLARKYLRTISPQVKAICVKHNIDYDMCSFSMALWKTLVHLKSAGSHFKLDPR